MRALISYISYIQNASIMFNNTVWWTNLCCFGPQMIVNENSWDIIPVGWVFWMKRRAASVWSKMKMQDTFYKTATFNCYQLNPSEIDTFLSKIYWTLFLKGRNYYVNMDCSLSISNGRTIMLYIVLPMDDCSYSSAW